MDVHQLDPLQDARWSQLVSKHALATVFHDPRWLQALKETYSYRPIAFTTSNTDEALVNGWVFCEVTSWLTGRRLVSLPFSDHCDPLVTRRDQLITLEDYLQQRQVENGWRYIETRPLATIVQPGAFQESATYVAQSLSLSPTTEQLFDRLHCDSIKRKIRRAQRHNVVVHEGTGDLLEQFYSLQLMTRRRHHLPPQPLRWFRNLLSCFANDCTIYVATLDDRPIASVLTLRFRKTLVYKYGASDAEYHPVGGMPLLFWHIIEHAKTQGLENLDLGRSNCDNSGLIRFKEHLGAESRQLRYLRCGSKTRLESAHFPRRMVRIVCSLSLPACITRAASSLFYGHAG